VTIEEKNVKTVDTFDTLEEQAQFENFLKEFRCVTCPNQSIADSQAPVATAMREEIYRQMKQGQNKEDIREYLLSRYGEYVLYRPLFEEKTFLLWVVPFILFVVGCFFWRRSNR